MLTPAFLPTAQERVLPRLALDFTTAVTDARVATSRALNTATRFNASGAIEIVNADLPRYDFNPSTLVCRGQLIEEARTNLFLNSLIDGTSLATQSVTLEAAAYALSFYGTGSIVISGGHSATVTGTGAFPTRTTYIFTPTAGSSTFTVSGTVNYAQVERGAFPTSFIPTGATSVSRNADIVTMTGTNFSSWYNATEGTFYNEVLLIGFSGAGRFGINVSDGTSANRMMQYLDVVTALNGRYTTSGVNITLGKTGISDMTVTPGKSVQAYKSNSFAFTVNGAAPATSASGSVPTVNRAYFNSIETGLATNMASGWLRKVMYWPQRLTDAEVQAFSK